MSSLVDERRQDRRVDVWLQVRIERVAMARKALYEGGLQDLSSKFQRTLGYQREAEKSKLLLNKLRSKHPELALYLETLEARMLLLAELGGGQLQILSERLGQKVNLSISGMRLHLSVMVQPDELLLLRVIDPQTCAGFVSLASVIYTQPPQVKDQGYNCQAAVEFGKLTDSDRRTLWAILDTAP